MLVSLWIVLLLPINSYITHSPVKMLFKNLALHSASNVIGKFAFFCRK